jgi:hypothetical protein
MPVSDIKQLGVMLDIVATSEHQGEADVALKKAGELIRKTGLRVSELTEAVAERDQALDLVKRYAARLDRAEAENKRLRARGNGSSPVGGLAARLWQDVGTINTVSRKSAEWLLDLVARELIHLKAKDLDFVQSCAQWTRPLTGRQEPWLLDLVRRAARQTGESPP